MAKKKDLYHKSRYYKKRQQQIKQRIAAAVAIVLLLVLILFIKGCVSRKAASVSAKAEQQRSDQTTANSVTEIPAADPVSLTVSVVGDCTLGTDEEFE